MFYDKLRISSSLRLTTRVTYDMIRSLLPLARFLDLLASLRKSLMGLSGLEPPTSRLSGVRSNQLSYRPLHLEEESVILNCDFVNISFYVFFRQLFITNKAGSALKVECRLNKLGRSSPLQSRHNYFSQGRASIIEALRYAPHAVRLLCSNRRGFWMRFPLNDKALNPK